MKISPENYNFICFNDLHNWRPTKHFSVHKIQNNFWYLRFAYLLFKNACITNVLSVMLVHDE